MFFPPPDQRQTSKLDVLMLERWREENKNKLPHSVVRSCFQEIYVFFFFSSVFVESVLSRSMRLCAIIHHLKKKIAKITEIKMGGKLEKT